MVVAGLKPKHVEGFVERWKMEGLAAGTIKNRMAELRWWAEKIGRQNVVARDNNRYGIGHP
ncbi:MAG: phage integrase N-terminal domain-containing protein [Thermoleophilia bacterium]